jgi:hypothetical protein
LHNTTWQEHVVEEACSPLGGQGAERGRGQGPTISFKGVHSMT